MKHAVTFNALTTEYRRLQRELARAYNRIAAGVDSLELGNKKTKRIQSQLEATMDAQVKLGREANKVENKLNIGLTAYQELQWLSAIKLYGKGIMDKSLLTKAQKDALLKAHK